MIDFKKYRKEHAPTNRQGVKRIFVFGSNRAGIHGKGAALFASKYYGAERGVGEGLTGLSYALPTKDHRIQTLPLEDIRPHVEKFIQTARQHPDIDFIVTRVGCGLAGYEDEDICPLFESAPDNCLFPGPWLDNDSLIIAGSRDLHETTGIGQDDFNKMVDHISANLDRSKLRVISGGANGADLMGERWAHVNNVPIVRFDADWDRLGKSAGMIRNYLLAHSGTHLAAYMKPGGSTGTQMMIGIAEKENIKTRVITLKAKESLSNKISP